MHQCNEDLFENHHHHKTKVMTTTLTTCQDLGKLPV